MGKLSIYSENKWLEHILLRSAFTVPTVVALALHTADPTEDGSGAEVSNSNNYSRVSCKTAFTSAASARTISNDGLITLPQASGSWGEVTHWSLWDSASYGAGNMLAYGSLTLAKTIISGQTPKVAIGEIDIIISALTSPAVHGMTTFCANQMLDHTFLNGDAGYTPAANYFCLGTGLFNDSGSYTNECAFFGNYSRLLLSDPFNSASNSEIDNKNAIEFLEATDSWGTVSDWCISTSGTEDAGDMLLYNSFDVSAGIDVGDTFNIPVGDLVINMS